jgi:maltose O-acetyltransferase
VTAVDWRRRAATTLGFVTTLSYRLSSDGRIKIGSGLMGNGRLRISGPGEVILEEDVNAWSHAETNRLITTRPQAVIRIGSNARLNGCTLIAAERIEVGAGTVLGSCEIRDHEPFGFAPERRRLPDPPKPIYIQEGAWIGGQVVVLPGVRVGRGSVVGLQAVVTEDVPPGVVAAGNPARVVRQIQGSARQESD